MMDDYKTSIFEMNTIINFDSGKRKRMIFKISS